MNAEAMQAILGGDTEALSPRMQLVARLLEQQRAAPVETPDEPPRRSTHQRQRICRTIHALTEELRSLREVNDTLARALGACFVCWGGDSTCPACAGRGTPGCYPPDPGDFQQFVLPAVRASATSGTAPRPRLPETASPTPLPPTGGHHG